MQDNSNYERILRKERNQRPPRGNDQPAQESKRGKQWSRENKRDQWATFPVADLNS